MISVVNKRVLRFLTFGNKDVTAMALWPFVIFKDTDCSNNKNIVNHERIHHRQQLELLILPYYIWYFIEYWMAMFGNGFNHMAAYMSISFEKEAYAKQSDYHYLDKRRWLASWPFFKEKFSKHDTGQKNSN